MTLSYAWEMLGFPKFVAPDSSPCVRTKKKVVQQMALNSPLHETHNINVNTHGIPSGYVKIAIENGHINSGFTHERW